MTLTVTHPDLPDPVQHVDMIDSESISQVMKTLSISGFQSMQLRQNGKTTWEDEKGGTHVLELEEIKPNG